MVEMMHDVLKRMAFQMRGTMMMEEEKEQELKDGRKAWEESEVSSTGKMAPRL